MKKKDFRLPEIQKSYFCSDKSVAQNDPEAQRLLQLLQRGYTSGAYFDKLSQKIQNRKKYDNAARIINRAAQDFLVQKKLLEPAYAFRF